MHTKIILIVLFLISCLWSFYTKRAKKISKKQLFQYLIASIPVIIYGIFGGEVWFYSFIGIIVWMTGFYFGEIVMWWGIWLLTLGSTYWYVGILGPIAITYLTFSKELNFITKFFKK